MVVKPAGGSSGLSGGTGFGLGDIPTRHIQVFADPPKSPDDDESDGAACAKAQKKVARARKQANQAQKRANQAARRAKNASDAKKVKARRQATRARSKAKKAKTKLRRWRRAAKGVCG